MAEQLQYFLGANSAQGFFSLYETLLPPGQAERIFLIKGGAGCGKSTLMRTVGQALEAQGRTIEYIPCSGDPDSLDGVYDAGAGLLLVDATAPHAMDARYGGITERYVDLSVCYDMDAMKRQREKLLSLSDAYRACYERAWRWLASEAGMYGDGRAMLLTEETRRKMARRARGILNRECRRRGREPGQVSCRFLSAVTCRGEVICIGTVRVLCPRLYGMEDTFGLSDSFLRQLRDGAAAAGYDVICCPSPLEPERLEHLLLPGLGLGFVNQRALPEGESFYRRIRFDAMPEAETLRTRRRCLRFLRRSAALLRENAVEELREAKALHDELEACFNPHVDFDRVGQITAAVEREVLSLLPD